MTKRMKRAGLTKRYNANLSISLIYKNKVIFNTGTSFAISPESSADRFATGWFGENNPQKWNPPKFRYSTKGQEARIR